MCKTADDICAEDAPVVRAVSSTASSTKAVLAPVGPAGLECFVWNDAQFRRIREAADVPTEFLREGWNFDSLSEGTGKGGGKMVFIGSKYIVKELSGEDHHTLLQIAESYAEHVLGGESLLCRMLLHFGDPRTGRQYLAMCNEMGKGPFSALYDLKGCNDDKALVFNGKKILPVPRRFWKVHLWCGRCAWNQDRQAYYFGKMVAAEAEFVVSEKRRAQISQQVERDTEWLQLWGLMDYSLLVAMLDPRGEEASTADQEHEGFRIGVIDFLQRWTLHKQLAYGAKACEENKATVPPDVYARRFKAHFEERFVSAYAPSHMPSARAPSSPRDAVEDGSTLEQPGKAIPAAAVLGLGSDHSSLAQVICL